MTSSTSIFESESLSKVDDNGVFFVTGCKVLSLRGGRRRFMGAQARVVDGLTRCILAVVLKPVSVSWEAARIPSVRPAHAQLTARRSLYLGKLLLLRSVS